jgi:enamine deaminase RidA (YjgF/YER057c/UK114 family)
MTHRLINPDKGYSNGVLAAPGRLLFVAGQIGWDRNRALSDDLAEQFERALSNVLDVVKEAGGEPTDVCRFTVYVTDKHRYIAVAKEIGARYRKLMGKHFPAMALVEVADLLEDRAEVEIEATAVIPEDR